MEKITIIIPTIWKGDSLKEFLKKIHSVERVSEIILIDNKNEDCKIDLTQFSKVFHKVMETNIFVNPAWNLGVKLSSNDIVVFAQDDIDFNPEFLEKIEVEENCLIGIDRKNFPPFSVEYNPQIVECKVRDWGFATLLILRKKTYIEIPDDLKIWCGDDYLFQKYPKKLLNRIE